MPSACAGRSSNCERQGLSEPAARLYVFTVFRRTGMSEKEPGVLGRIKEKLIES
jgi:hypothetical protein